MSTNALKFARAILLQLIIVCLLLAAVEVAFRLIAKPKARRASFKLAGDLMRPKAPESPTHIPVHVPDPAFSEGRLNPSPGLGRLYYDNDYTVVDPELGFAVPGASRKYVSRAFTTDEKLIYEVTYSIDEFNRRVTPDGTGIKRNDALLFLGCSFVYGEGLQDGETLPAQVAKLTPRFKVYNYGFHGWGPGNVLRRVSKRDFPKEVPERRGKAIYLFIDAQFPRLAGSMSGTRAYLHQRANLPDYDLDDRNHLDYRGNYYDGRPWETLLFGLLGQSQFLNYYAIDFPSRFTDRHFKLFARLLKETKDRLREEVGVDDFYVALYPGSTLARSLIPYLDALGIASLDYSQVEMGKYVDPPRIPGDGHPTPQAQEFLAKLLVGDLDLGE